MGLGILGWLALSLLATAAGDEEKPRPHLAIKALARRYNRTGQYRTALRQIRPLNEQNPDDPDFHAILGTAYGRMGLFGDAAAEFAMASGSSYYEEDGLDAHADTLRAFGRGDDAAELRLQRPLSVDGERAELVALLGAIDDLRAAGDLEGAERACWIALSIRPDSGAFHAALADVLLDFGDRDAAEYHLWIGELRGVSAARMLVVEARLAIADGDWGTATEFLMRARKGRRRDLELLSFWAEATRRGGDPQLADDALSRKLYQWHDRPELLAVTARVRWDLGLEAPARQALDRALVLYPDHPDVAAAQAHLAGP